MVYVKGLLPLTLTLLGIIFTTAMVVSIILISLVFKYNITINLKFEYDKSYSDLIMLSLFRLNYIDASGKAVPIYKILSQRDVDGFPTDVQEFIKNKIQLLGDTECFRLANTTHTVLKTDCDAYEYAGEAFIFKPYNPDKLVEEFTLTYNKVKRT